VETLAVSILYQQIFLVKVIKQSVAVYNPKISLIRNDSLDGGLFVLCFPAGNLQELSHNCFLQIARYRQCAGLVDYIQ
jgi:hypothetical protein